MPIFPILELEEKVQTNDKTRLDGTKSFKTDEVSAISQVRIKPDTAGIFIEVAVSDPTDYTKWYLDWAYNSTGTKTVTIEFTDSEVVPNVTTVTKDIVVVSAASENLFSKDSDFNGEESDILKYVKPGRSSFINVHRAAQDNILQELWKVKVAGVTSTGDIRKLDAADFVDINEIKQWSKYMSLRMIYDDLSNAVDDVFAAKANKYLEKEKSWRELSLNNLSFDADGDAVVENSETAQNFRSGDLVRQ